MNSLKVLGGTPFFNRQLADLGNTDAFRGLKICEKTAFAAFEIMRRIRPQLTDYSVRSKEAPCDWVTEADTSIQAEQIRNILAEFPAHKIIAEEDHDEGLTATTADTDVWYLDGVDGTAAFAGKTENIFGKMDYLLPGFVQFGMQMAFLRGGIPMCSIFAAPEMDIDGSGYSIFEAVDGIDGIFLNGRKVAFMADGPLENSLSLLSFRGEAYENGLRDHLIASGITGRHITRSVSTGSEYALLIQRPIELSDFNVITTERQKPWDLIPGAFLIEKAGGGIRFLDGRSVFPFYLDMLGADGRANPVVAASLSNLSLIFSMVRAFKGF